MKKETIMEIIKGKNIKFIKLMFADISGDLRMLEIPAECIETALDGKLLIDGSSIRGLATIHNSDIFLRPDFATFTVLPYLDNGFGGVASLMCDLLNHTGEEMPTCSRSNLKRELRKMNSLGFTLMNIGFEPEFFLLKSKNYATVKRADLVNTGNYCGGESTDDCTIIRREIMHELMRAGLDVICANTERATSQHEITYRYREALSACDTLLLVKFLIKTIAKARGYSATFMPKLVKKVNGSGLHTNVSLATAANRNAFTGSDSEIISDTAKSFTAGVLKHARALAFLTNPSINSYKRLVPGYEAPVNICWSTANRSAMIRVPGEGAESARIEIRCTDSTANPYLAVSAILAGGLDGIKNKMIVPEPIGVNAYDLTEVEKKKMKLMCLPNCLTEALAEFALSDVIKSAVTPEIVEVLIKMKTEEICDYRTHIGEFDFVKYFNV